MVFVTPQVLHIFLSSQIVFIISKIIPCVEKFFYSKKTTAWVGRGAGPKISTNYHWYGGMVKNTRNTRNWKKWKKKEKYYLFPSSARPPTIPQYRLHGNVW